MRQWTEKERKRQACVIRRSKPWRKSTGPRTKAGKEKSKYNATKHNSRSASFIRMRKALAAQSAFLKSVNETCKADIPLCDFMRHHGRAVTNELLSALDNFEHPTPAAAAKILQFHQNQAQKHKPPPDYAQAA